MTGHATQGVNQLLKKSMQGSARYRREMTVTQWRLMPHPRAVLYGVLCHDLPANLTLTVQVVNNL